jgi:hypothetical protein
MLRWVVVVVGLCATEPAAALCQQSRGPGGSGLYDATDVTALSRAWLPAIEKLARAIPTLSPRETEWLNSEKAAGGDRLMRAISSSEAAQQSAKQEAQELFLLVGNLARALDRDGQARILILIQQNLLKTSTVDALVEIVTRSIITRESLPYTWISFSIFGGSLERSVIDGRALMALDIARCALPAVLRIGLLR